MARPKVEMRREHERHAVDLRVEYSARDAFLSSQVTNLSRGGLFIGSDNPLPIGVEVDLTLTLPGLGAPFRARGRVIWNYDIEMGSAQPVPGIGIKLVDMTLVERQKLAEYLDTLPPVEAAATPF